MKKHKSIMVIDDEQTILTLLSRTLEQEGCNVVVADNGVVILELLKEHRPELVILDIMIPGLDDFQVLNLIRQRANVPVIMLSGKREVTIKRDTLVLGADDYVGKPFHAGELVARIKAKLRRVGTEITMADKGRVIIWKNGEG
ncbi:response regulator transcription factor [Chloroflexota bacterium]